MKNKPRQLLEKDQDSENRERDEALSKAKT
jgi:hypothetical protein